MNSKTIKELLNIEDITASNDVWHDWFSDYHTLLGKYKRIIKPILRALPKKYLNYYIFVKESVPMWCNGYVYKVFITKDKNSLSDISIGKSETSYYAYIFNGEPNPIKEIDNVKSIKEIKQWLLENC